MSVEILNLGCCEKTAIQPCTRIIASIVFLWVNNLIPQCNDKQIIAWLKQQSHLFPEQMALKKIRQ